MAVNIVERTFPAFTLGAVQAQRVYAKTAWDDDWDLQSLVYCRRAQWTIAPAISQAELYYRYGYGLTPGAGENQIINPYTLPLLAYVKIEIDVVDYDSMPASGDTTDAVTTTIRYWYGVTGTLVDRQGGVRQDPVDGNDYRAGVQVLPCVGLEWLLERDYVENAWYTDSTGQVRESETPIDFRGDTRRANRTQTRFEPDGLAQCYIFSSGIHNDTSSNDTADWTYATAAEYLVNTYQPAGGLRWEWTDPDQIAPTIPMAEDYPLRVRGRNARRRRLLNEILPRQRGLSYRVHVDNDTETVHVSPISFADEDVGWSYADFSLTTLRANPNQFNLKMESDRSGRLQITSDAFQKYHRIRARGDRAQFMFPVSIADDTLEKGWGDGDQQDYAKGASQETGYPPADEQADRERANRSFRAQPQFDDVYSLFRIKRTFAETPVHKEGFDGGENPAIIEVDTSGWENDVEATTADQRPQNWGEMTVLPQLPIQVGLDPNDTDGQGNFVPHVYPLSPPLCFFRIPGKPNHFIDSRHIGLLADIEGFNEDDHFNWSATVVAEPDEPAAFRLRVAGMPRHVIDGENFNALPEDPDVGGWDYTTAVFVVAVQSDQYAEATWPDPVTGDPEPLRERVIHLPGYQKNYCAANTPFKLKGPLNFWIDPSDAWLRDDTDQLRAVAKMAWIWYGTERKALEFETSLTTDAFEIGDMIARVEDATGRSEVNSVITEIAISFNVSESATGAPPPPRIKYKTGFANLDIAALF